VADTGGQDIRQLGSATRGVRVEHKAVARDCARLKVVPTLQSGSAPRDHRKTIVTIKIATLTVLLAVFLAFQPRSAHAAAGHENACTVINVNYSETVMTIICGSNSINMGLLNGSSSAGTCPTVNMDTIKIWVSLALAARVSGLYLTIWYTDGCGADGSATIRAINSIEVKGN
jgi:hypothetical protein